MKEEIYKIVDDYLNHLKLNDGNGSLHSIGGSFYSTEATNAKELMIEYNLISLRDNNSSSSIVDITLMGLDILETGGIKNYIDNISRKLDKKELLESTKLKYETANAKRIFKTYWWTFGMALLALLLSLYTFIMSFFK